MSEGKLKFPAVILTPRTFMITVAFNEIPSTLKLFPNLDPFTENTSSDKLDPWR